MSLVLRSLVECLTIPVTKAIQRVKNSLSGFLSRGRAEDFWNISPEPASSLFCSSFDVTVVEVENPEDPLKVAIRSEVRGNWTPQAKEMIDTISQKWGIDLRPFLRGGGPYQTNFQNKKWDRIANQRDEIIEALDWFKLPEFEEVKPEYLNLIDEFHQRTLRNLEYLHHHPEEAVVGKPPTTGTGWEYPIDTREHFSQNFNKDYIYEDVRREIDEYYVALKEALQHWPEYGADIYLSGLFKTIQGGTRSDADIVEAIDDLREDGSIVPMGRMTIVTKARKVGVTPSSVAHSAHLNPTSWQRSQWQAHGSEYHLYPFDNETFALFAGAKFATEKADPEELVYVNADFGKNQHPARIDESGALVIPDPGKTLGADNLVMAGINLFCYNTRQGDEQIVAMMESGAPETMQQYEVALKPIVVAARKAGITPAELKMMNVGDDLHILIKAKHLGWLFSKFGMWLKVKGMQTFQANGKKYHAIFILGHYWIKPEGNGEIMAFIAPRFIKSATSANLAGKNLPPTLEVGKTYHIESDPEVAKQIDELWRDYRDHIYFRGTVAEYQTILRNNYMQAKIQLAAIGGISEWMADQLQTQASDLGVMPKPKVIGEQAPAGTPIVKDELAAAATPGSNEQASVKGVVIYGLPTTGKTELARELIAAGKKVVDTDDILKGIRGPSTELKGQDVYPTNKEKVHALVKSYLDQDYILVTNLHEIIKNMNLKTDIAVVRPAATLFRIFNERQPGKLTMEEANDWTSNDTFEKIKGNVGEVQVLKDDEFLNTIYREKYGFEEKPKTPPHPAILAPGDGAGEPGSGSPDATGTKPNPENAPKKSAFAALQVKDGFVFIQSAKHGKLHPAGGKAEGSEDHEQALVRELREELGVAGTPKRTLLEGLTTYEDGAFEEKFYLIEVPEVPAVTLDKSEPVVTLTRDQLKATPADQFTEVGKKIREKIL